MNEFISAMESANKKKKNKLLGMLGLFEKKEYTSLSEPFNISLVNYIYSSVNDEEKLKLISSNLSYIYDNMTGTDRYALYFHLKQIRGTGKMICEQRNLVAKSIKESDFSYNELSDLMNNYSKQFKTTMEYANFIGDCLSENNFWSVCEFVTVSSHFYSIKINSPETKLVLEDFFKRNEKTIVKSLVMDNLSEKNKKLINDVYDEEHSAFFVKIIYDILNKENLRIYDFKQLNIEDFNSYIKVDKFKNNEKYQHNNYEQDLYLTDDFENMELESTVKRK